MTIWAEKIGGKDHKTRLKSYQFPRSKIRSSSAAAVTDRDSMESARHYKLDGQARSMDSMKV